MAVIKPFRQVQNIKRKDLNFDLVDHIWIANFVINEEIDRIRALWDEEQVMEARVNDDGQKAMREDLRRSKLVWIHTGVNDWIYDRLAQACLQVNTNRFKFDITGFQTELQMATYDVGDFFEWHMDYGPGTVSNRKLSITVQLSDPSEYDGGELQFLINKDIVNAPREKGTAIIFPSYAMHRVQPVTRGSRKSIVGWIAGAPYR